MPRRPPRRFSRTARLVALGAAVALLAPSAAPAWQPTPEQMEAMKAAAMSRRGGPKPDGESKPDEKKPDGDDNSKGGKEDAAPKVLQRPTEPPKENLGYDDRTFFSPDPDGRYQFNFRGAPWPAVLTQLADVSGLSFDWQELPGDYLNLRTQRGYTAAEARDLLNRHLLARGFTLLVDGEVMTVANLAKLDPALVPGVDPRELAGLPPHSFVKTVFALDWLPADKAAEELKPLLSPHGTLVPLSGTNRLLALDAAANLAALHGLLAEEQDGRGRERLVQQFVFKHVRAEHAKSLLEDFLGLSEKKEDALPKDPRQAQMEMQMRMQQAQQNKGGDKTPEPAVRLIVNSRENAILAQAPPEQMAVIERSVEALDVPGDPTTGLLRRMIEDSGPVRIYRLARLDPELFVKLLTDTGELNPMTRIEVDKTSKSLLVSATAADHLVIGKLVEQLDGNERQFEVLKLRRLPADYVAGSIRFMMGLEEEKEDDSSSRRRSYYYSYYGDDDKEEEDEEGQFRVDADVENNRLLLYANSVELEEIRGLLVKLGEVRPDGGGRRTVRVLDVTDEQAAELLRRLEEVWPRVEDNPLEIDPGPVRDPESPPADPQPAGDTDGDVATAPRVRVRTAKLVQETAPRPGSDADGDAKPAGPPVRIRRTPDGRLELSSDDTAALDALEDLAIDLTPPTRDFHVFQLRHTDYVAWIIGNLEDFFQTEEGDGQMVRDWYGGYVKAGGDDSPSRLSSRKPLAFIGDIDTRTILVQNATPAQIRQIDELLKVWDRPPDQKGGARRLTEMFTLKAAEAQQVADTLKDVYRDLLSANDPALQNKNAKGGEGGEKTVEKVYSYFGGGGGEDEGGPDREDPVRFKGLLSIGVHAESNTLVVSATETLMANVVQLVEALEAEAAREKSASFVWQGGPRAEGEIRGRLKDVFGERLTITAPGEKPVRVGAARTTGEE